MPVGITNFLNVEQLWTCSSYFHALKNVTASQVKKQMPQSQTGEPMCVTAEPPAHSTVQSLALRHILMRMHCKVFMNFNDYFCRFYCCCVTFFWVGQKVHWEFSYKMVQKIQTSSLTNPIFCFTLNE